MLYLNINFPTQVFYRVLLGLGYNLYRVIVNIQGESNKT